MPVSSSSHFGFPSAGLTGRPQGPQPGSSAFDTLFPTELLGHRLRPSSRSGGRAEAAGTVCQPSAPSSALSGLSVSSSEAAGCLWRRCLQGPFILTPWISQHVSGLEPDLLFLLLQVPGSPQRVLSVEKGPVVGDGLGMAGCVQGAWGGGWRGVSCGRRAWGPSPSVS